jgi:UTP--glucose-1-phosphate uridylyltransferase
MSSKMTRGKNLPKTDMIKSRLMTDIAVVPAAGYGKRMFPLSLAVPKEMLPVGRIPLVELTIRELAASGIKKICIVLRAGKELIRHYLDRRRETWDYGVEIFYVSQEAPLGLGDALRAAEDFIQNRPFVMAIPDQVLLAPMPATAQLLKGAQATAHEGIWSSLVRVPKSELPFFAGARPFSWTKAGDGDYLVIKGFSTNAGTTLRGFGRTLFLPAALGFMTEDYKNEVSGEVDLEKTFNTLKEMVPLYGMELQGVPCDLGTWEGYYHYLSKVLKHTEFCKRPTW